MATFRFSDSLRMSSFEESGLGPGGNSSLLTADQVAALLGVTRSWVYQQSRLGRIPTVTLGRYRRYRREAIEAWVRQLECPTRGLARDAWRPRSNGTLGRQ